MPNISAPYNFVPLNKEVFFPPWADFVSHDIPFKEGLSGKIELEITAESPIFIRKPYEKGDDFYTNTNGEKVSKEFCFKKIMSKDGTSKKQYFIPGSSLRNMLRSIVEIISFGKLKPEDFMNTRFGVRDFYNKDVYTLIDDTENIKIGYLKKLEDTYYIYDKGKPKKIKQDSINYNNEGRSFTLKSLFDKNSSNNTAKDFKNNNVILKSKAKTAKFKYDTTKLYLEPNKGGYVFTGQPTFNNFQTAKSNEFIIDFFQEKDEHYKIEPIQYEDFKFVYGDYKGSKEMSVDWKMWKEKLEMGQPIPIFFREKDGVIKDFGLSFLYKMLYQERIEKAISNIQPRYNSNKYDMVDLLFGSVNQSKLKGRVHINHAFSNDAEVYKDYKIVLSNPKASYYPFYIEQNLEDKGDIYKIEGAYKTFNNSEARIKGRKQYPLHKLNIENNIATRKQERVATSIKPLKEKTKFTTNLSFHNLLPAEVGALLSALTFHKNDNCRHNIGAGKPFGLGQIKIKPTIKEIKSVFKEGNNYNVEYFLNRFESEISKKIENWVNSVQLTELFTIHSITAKEKFKNFEYLSLRDFAATKREKNALPLYSKTIDFEEKVKTTLNEPIQLKLNNEERLENYIINLKKKIYALEERSEQEQEEGYFELNEGDYVGTVKFYNRKKGYGYIIERTTKKEYYYSKENVCESFLNKGDIVIFTIEKGNRGPEAYDVEFFDKNKHAKNSNLK